FFFSSRRRHTRCLSDWSSDVCSSDLIERVRDAVNPSLEIEGIVLTMYDERMNLSRQVAEEVRTHFADKIYSTIIPRNVRLGEARSEERRVGKESIARWVS